MVRLLSGMIFLACAMSQPPNQVVRQAGKLGLHQPVERELGRGETDVFTVDAVEGQFWHVVVQQQGIYVVVALVDPDGRSFEAPETMRAFGASPASRLCSRTGVHQIRISASQRASLTGRYRVELTELRSPTDEDRTQLQAESEFVAASHDHGTKDKQGLYRAIEGYQRAAALWHSIRYDAGEALCLQRIGNIRYSFGEQRKALEYYNRALALWHGAGEEENAGSALGDMGIAYYHLGDMQAALDYQNRAIALYRLAGDRISEARALLNMANVYGDTGDRLKAIDTYKQVLILTRATGERGGEAAALNNLGWAYHRMGEMQQALDYYTQSLPLRRLLKDGSGEALTLKNIGAVYWRLGERQKALDYFDRALPLYRTAGDRWGEAGALDDAGAVYQELGDLQKAFEYENNALALYKATADRPGQATVWNNIGTIYYARGDRSQALKCFREALRLARAVADRDTEAETLNDLGMSYQAQGKISAALRYYVEALRLADAVENPYPQGEILNALMDFWQARHNPGLAIFFGKRSVNRYQDVRRNIKGLDQDLQRSYLATVSRNYRKLADLLISEGRLSEAEQVLALLKEQEFFDYVRRDASEATSVGGRANLSPEETEAEKRYREIEDKLVSIGVERGDLIAKKSLTPEETQRLRRLEKDIVTGNQAFERFLGGLARQFAAKPGGGVRVEELREAQGLMDDLRELPKGTVAIFTLVGEDNFRVILRTPDVQKAYEYPIKGVSLNRKVLDLRQAAQDPTRDPRPLAEELYRIVIGPMVNDLQAARAETLMWSLDGTLRYLPLAMLYDGAHYLIEQYRLSVITLASNARLLGRPDADWRAAGFGVTRAYGDDPALPSVAAELAGIIATKPGDAGVLAGEIKLDEEFTQAAMRETLLKRYPVVHIASHFRFEPGNETQSFLLLGDGAHLSLAELKTSANLFGGVQLLTLSACNTGIGDGAEVEGFGALAQRQGARAVVASLWAVMDESTSLLMQEFYRIRQSSPQITKLEALRHAQLELLHGLQKGSAGTTDRGIEPRRQDRDKSDAEAYFVADPKAPFSHPYYWAPFFLMGNWL